MKVFFRSVTSGPIPCKVVSLCDSPIFGGLQEVLLHFPDNAPAWCAGRELSLPVVYLAKDIKWRKYGRGYSYIQLTMDEIRSIITTNEGNQEVRDGKNS